VKKPRIPVDAFTDSAIREKICEFYVVKKECPSIRRFLKVPRKENFLDCRLDFLCKRLHKTGFQWGQCATNRKILIERHDVAVWRTHYLHEIRKHRREGKKHNICRQNVCSTVLFCSVLLAV
jgi:hypothetical protein